MTGRRKQHSSTSLIMVAIAGALVGAAIAFGLVFFWQAKADYRTAEQRGRDLAILVCARCHAIGAVGKSTNPASPPFRDLVDKLSREGLEEALEVALSLGHKPMPPWNLSPEQAVDLAVYIESLKKPS